ncbi:putative 3-deoxy-8-phosphooctulonate synthase [Dioscorea sansibarensis]
MFSNSSSESPKISSLLLFLSLRSLFFLLFFFFFLETTIFSIDSLKPLDSIARKATLLALTHQSILSVSSSNLGLSRGFFLETLGAVTKPRNSDCHWRSASSLSATSSRSTEASVDLQRRELWGFRERNRVEVLIAGKVFDEMPKRGKHLPGRSALRYGSILVGDRGSEGKHRELLIGFGSLPYPSGTGSDKLPQQDASPQARRFCSLVKPSLLSSTFAGSRIQTLAGFRSICFYLGLRFLVGAWIPLWRFSISSSSWSSISASDPFFLLAGPNVIESEEHVLTMAKHIKSITSKLGLSLVFKSSFDKANRTSSKSFRGPGLEEGLKILEKVKITYDLPIVTDVHESHQCEAVGRVADIIQIPAFLCRQTDLLVAAAKTGKIINIKKGQFCAPSVMVNSAEKVRLAGNQNVMVCERGTMFGYNDLIVDPRNFEWMREANCPVVADVTHSLQQPAGKKLEGGGVASGGLRELIPCIARTSVAVGVDGIFMEVHDDPLNAPVDGPTQWPLRHLEELLEELIAIARVSKGKKPLKIDLTPFHG